MDLDQAQVVISGLSVITPREAWAMPCWLGLAGDTEIVRAHEQETTEMMDDRIYLQLVHALESAGIDPAKTSGCDYGLFQVVSGCSHSADPKSKEPSLVTRLAKRLDWRGTCRTLVDREGNGLRGILEVIQHLGTKQCQAALVFAHDDAGGHVFVFLLQVLEKARAAQQSPVKTPQETLIARASPAQTALFAMQSWYPDSCAFHLPTCFRLREALDVRLLEGAFEQIIERHESLRTRFQPDQHRLMQVIAPAPTLSLTCLDLSRLEDHAFRNTVKALAEARFELQEGPLFRPILLKRGRLWLLFWTAHHMIFDGVSSSLLITELSQAYDQLLKGISPKVEPLTHYRSFSQWQWDYVRSDEGALARAWWLAELADLPQGKWFPTERGGSDGEMGGQQIVRRFLDAKVLSSLVGVAREHRISMFSLLLGAYAMVLQHYCSREDLVILSPQACRPQSAFEKVIGYFINMIALRIRLGDDPRLGQLIKRAHQVVIDALDHATYPFSEVVEGLGYPHGRERLDVFGTCFVYQNWVRGAAGSHFAGGHHQDYLGAEAIDLVHETGGHELTLEIFALGDRHLAFWKYNANSLSPSFVEQMISSFETLLALIPEYWQRHVSELSLLPPAQWALLCEAGGLQSEIQEREDVVRRFVQVAKRHGGRTALQQGDHLITYDTLLKQAGGLAHHLRGWGIGPETAVGLTAIRNTHTFVAQLAVMMCGGVFVPFDPRAPETRNRVLLHNARAELVLASEPDPSLAEYLGLPVISLVEEAIEPANPTEIEFPPDLGAYIIYTSGSTGTPKGVMVSRGALSGFVASAIETYGIVHEDRLLQFASLCFDTSMEEIYPALCSGAALVLREDDMAGSAELFWARCCKWEISILDLPTSYWHHLLYQTLPEQIPESLRLTIIGGERAGRAHLRRWLAQHGDNIQLLNTYGPTETTVAATRWEACSVWRREHEGMEVPIGRPLPGATCYVVDRYLKPLSVGVPGELLLGGTMISRGYVGLPVQTATAFVPDPFSQDPGARLYRTGDLANWSEIGERLQLVYLGRIDKQIKRRGYRIEPGEIESIILKQKQVAAAFVATRVDPVGETRLVAWYSTHEEQDVDTATLRNELQRQLPDYMIPDAFITLDRLPLTANGKVGVRALPDPDWHAGSGDSFTPPKHPEETLLSEIWEEVLGRERVASNANFFELGGHSLLALRVLTRVRKIFRIDLPLREMFAAPTITGMAERIRRDRASEAPPMLPLEAVAREEHYPLTNSQQRLWFIEQLDTVGEGYVISLGIEMKGPLRPDLFEACIPALLERHESLRSGFAAREGEPYAFTIPHATYTLPVVDTTAVSWTREQLQQIAQASANRPFDLAQPPLFRALLLRLRVDTYLLLLHTHHIISDAWSIEMLLREWGQLYGAACRLESANLEPLTVQFPDYVHWYNQHLPSPGAHPGLSWWREQLRDAPQHLSLPYDFPRPRQRCFRGALFPFAIPADLAESFRKLAREQSATLFTAALAVFKVLLMRYTGVNDLVLGTPMANRDRLALETMFGFLVNTMVLRTRLSSRNPSFDQLLDQVHEGALAAFAHEIPFESLVATVCPDRKGTQNPIFQVVFQYLPMPPSQEVEGVRFQGADFDFGIARFDLSLQLCQRDGQLHGKFEYNTRLFKASTIEAMARHYLNLLTGFSQNPSEGVFTVPLLHDAESKRLLSQWNQPPVALPDQNLMRVFDSVSARRHEQVALMDGQESLTYADLKKASEQIASHLANHGIGPGDHVGICLRTCKELIESILAILRLGAIYVPIEPDYPDTRISFMVSDAAISHIIASETLCELQGVTWLKPEKADERRTSRVEYGAQQGAYICYTSGSTGKPKGVVVSHGNVLRLVNDREYVAVQETDCMAQVSNPAFDAFTFELWATLLNGARMTLVAKHTYLLPGAFAEYIAAHDITLAFLTSAVFTQCARERPDMFAGMNYLVVGGDKVDPDAVRRVFTAGGPKHLVNGYGPTETTTFAITHPIQQEAKWESIPIGKPIAHTTAYVLDPFMRPVPAGVPGELYLGGAGLSWGYLSRGGFTAQHFVPDPFGQEQGARLYRTGDLVRQDAASGDILFLGRRDKQLKIRGYRVEPGEVEICLQSIPDMGETVVRSWLGAQEDAYLAAWYVGDHDPEKVRRYLEKHLPGFMVPRSLIPIEKIPLNANGKLDLSALPDPDAYRSEDQREITPPRTVLERNIAEVWGKLLGVEALGIHDNFFHMGAHSLIMSRASSRLWDMVGISLPIDILFEHPTVAELAQYIEIARWSRQNLAPADDTFEEEGRI